MSNKLSIGIISVLLIDGMGFVILAKEPPAERPGVEQLNIKNRWKKLQIVSL